MKFLIDENLPDYLKAWSSKEFLHVTKIAKSIPEEIWKYALENNLVIMTRDSDFHERILLESLRQKTFYLKLETRQQHI